MADPNALNRRFSVVAWGALFIWIGALSFVPGQRVPFGTGLLGIGIILLGINLARRLSNIPINGGSTTFGVMALLVGVVVLSLSLQGIRVDLPFFPVLLVVIGVVLLVHSATGMKCAPRTKMDRRTEA